MASQTISKQTRNNWWIDAALVSSALIASLSGIYFLFLPIGGFQGGRNPLYNVQVIFSRHTWDDLHTWGGVAMIFVALVHLVRHWSWVVNMSKRTWNELTGKCGCMNWRGRWNMILNAIVGISFVLTAVSGIYFLFVPGSRWVADPLFLFTRTSWDLVHTWAGTVMIATTIIHFAIHWKWITKVTRKMYEMVFRHRHVGQPEMAAN